MLENKFCWIPTGSLLSRVGGWVGGWRVGGTKNKANSVQIQLNLPVWTELGNLTDQMRTHYQNHTYHNLQQQEILKGSWVIFFFLGVEILKHFTDQLGAKISYLNTFFFKSIFKHKKGPPYFCFRFTKSYVDPQNCCDLNKNCLHLVGRETPHQ